LSKRLRPPTFANRPRKELEEHFSERSCWNPHCDVAAVALVAIPFVARQRGLRSLFHQFGEFVTLAAPVALVDRVSHFDHHPIEPTIQIGKPGTSESRLKYLIQTVHPSIRRIRSSKSCS